MQRSKFDQEEQKYQLLLVKLLIGTAINNEGEPRDPYRRGKNQKNWVGREKERLAQLKSCEVGNVQEAEGLRTVRAYHSIKQSLKLLKLLDFVKFEQSSFKSQRDTCWRNRILIRSHERLKKKRKFVQKNWGLVQM